MSLTYGSALINEELQDLRTTIKSVAHPHQQPHSATLWREPHSMRRLLMLGRSILAYRTPVAKRRPALVDSSMHRATMMTMTTAYTIS